MPFIFPVFFFRACLISSFAADDIDATRFDAAAMFSLRHAMPYDFIFIDDACHY